MIAGEEFLFRIPLELLAGAKRDRAEMADGRGAMADFNVLATTRADLRGTTASTACAFIAGSPWICRTTSRIFCADIRTFFVIA